MKLKVNDPQYSFNECFTSQKPIELLKQAICCNAAKVPSPTEQALTNMIKKFGVDQSLYEQKFLPPGFERFPFTSKRKKMSIILENIPDNQFGYNKRIHMKGAAEIVLKFCNYYIN